MVTVLKRYNIFLLVLLLGTTTICAEEKPIVVTEYHYGLAPKYFGIVVHDVEHYFPSYIETSTTYDSPRSFWVYQATRGQGLIHRAAAFMRQRFIQKGKERQVNQKEFFELFARHPRFNFVLTDHELLFTYTNKRPWTAFKSKHIILANTQTRVRCAGEMFLREENKVKVLVLSNSSGSYRPRPHLLPALLRLLQEQLNLAEDNNFAIKMHPLYFASDEEQQQFQRDYEHYLSTTI